LAVHQEVKDFVRDQKIDHDNFPPIV
jgi:hypothetical protein